MFYARVAGMTVDSVAMQRFGVLLLWHVLRDILTVVTWTKRLLTAVFMLNHRKQWRPVGCWIIHAIVIMSSRYSWWAVLGLYLQTILTPVSKQTCLSCPRTVLASSRFLLPPPPPPLSLFLPLMLQACIGWPPPLLHVEALGCIHDEILAGFKGILARHRL